MKSVRRALLGLFACFLACAPANTQSVQQSGGVTQGHQAVWATNGVIKDGGAVAANQSLMGGSATTTAAGNTVYCAAPGCGTSVATASQVPFTGTLSNLSASVATAPGSGKSVVVTVYTGAYGSAAASTLTCTIANTATSCTDTAHQVNLPLGTTWTIQFSVGSGATSTGGQAGSVQFTSSAPPTPTTPFVLQSGVITSGHSAIWTTNGVIQDGGTPVTSAIAPGPFTAGNLVFVNNLLQLADSGIVASSIVAGPATTVVGHVATWGNTTGTLLADGGVVASGQLSPGGRLTLANGVCNPSTDSAAATILYYTPCVGKSVPINNGTGMAPYTFISSSTDTVGLSIILGNLWVASTLYDVFVGLNGTTVTLCTGPAWSVTGAGTSLRGSGAGTSQLVFFDGIPTNAVSMTCRYSNTQTFTCAINQCTYLGTFITSLTTDGQIDLLFGSAALGGGTACICIWNLYNQNQARPNVQDTNATPFSPAPGSWVMAMGSNGNRIRFVSGLALQAYTIGTGAFAQTGNTSGDDFRIGCALNSTAPTNPDTILTMSTVANVVLTATQFASCRYSPAFGFNYVSSVYRSGTHAATFSANIPNAQYTDGLIWF